MMVEADDCNGKREERKWTVVDDMNETIPKHHISKSILTMLL
jgi:hypothetical protein